MPRRREGVKRPRIYGSEAKCRAALARYIDSGEELLDQAVGVQNQIASVRKTGRDPELVSMIVEEAWAKDFRRWFNTVAPVMGRYLQDQYDVMPVIALGLPPDTGKPRHTIALDNGVPWLQEALKELRGLQAVLGVRRDVAAAAPAPARFEELHAAGLVNEKVVNDRAKEMRAPRTPGQLSKAIGAAKELTEATLRAALERLGEPYAPRDDLPVLMRKWRAAVNRVAPPDPEGQAILDRAQAALASIVTFLAEWRNAYGGGHGRPRYPPGLRARHARLAADAAETCVRFIATTMDGLELLPPP